MTAQNLRDRWDQALLLKTNNEIGRQAKTKRTLFESPFGVTADGKMDYRGFTLAVPILYSMIDKVDFTMLSCDWAGCLTDCVLTNSTFVSAAFDGRFLTKNFNDCSFRKASLKKVAMGNSSYLRCEFSSANMSAAMAHGATFASCDFTDVNFKQAVMQKCVFESCLFGDAKFKSASFVGSRFKNCNLDRVSLESAMLDHVEFE
jgi:fluoroquinolone resistance protein